jgi:Fe2+ transport system protein B
MISMAGPMQEMLGFVCVVAIIFLILAMLIRMAIVMSIIIDETARWLAEQIRESGPKPRRDHTRR